jgi:hypothetical protein
MDITRMQELPADRVIAQLLGAEGAKSASWHQEGPNKVLHYDGYRVPVELNSMHILQVDGEVVGRMMPNGMVANKNNDLMRPKELADTTRLYLDGGYLLDQSPHQDRGGLEAGIDSISTEQAIDDDSGWSL